MRKRLVLVLAPFTIAVNATPNNIITAQNDYLKSSSISFNQLVKGLNNAKTVIMEGIFGSYDGSDFKLKLESVNISQNWFKITVLTTLQFCVKHFIVFGEFKTYCYTVNDNLYIHLKDTRVELTNSQGNLLLWASYNCDSHYDCNYSSRIIADYTNPQATYYQIPNWIYCDAGQDILKITAYR